MNKFAKTYLTKIKNTEDLNYRCILYQGLVEYLLNELEKQQDTLNSVSKVLEKARESLRFKS